MNNLNYSIFKVIQLLQQIPADNYDVWFKVGCALKHLHVPYEIFKEWSAKSEKFDEKECQAKWEALPSKTRAGLVTLRKYASANKDDAQGASQTADTEVLCSQDANGAESSAPSCIFIAPPEKMLAIPRSDEERIYQAAWMIMTLFRPEERFEFCEGRIVQGQRIVPDRNGDLSKIYNDDTLELLCQNVDLASEITGATTGCYIGMNPVLVPEGSQAKAPNDSMITDHRVALLECDELPLEEQWNILKTLRLPIIAVLFSGNKSLHVLCRIDAGTDRALYDKRVEALYQYAETHGLKPDTSCRNPSRLTRCPGFMRGEKMQYLVSESWGYSDWDSFEQEELAAIIPANSPVASETAPSTPALTDDVAAKYGFPYTLSSTGAAKAINHRFFAAITAQLWKIKKVDGLFWRYEETTGLWEHVYPEELRRMIADTVLQFGLRDGVDLCCMAPAPVCQSIASFIEPEHKSPFQNRDRKIIHVNSGVLELGNDGTSTLNPFSAEYYSRNRCEIIYDPNAECPRFLHELLEAALPQEDIDILQLYCGQCLLGDNFTQTFLVLTGTAGGGKGTIVSLIRSIIGEANCAEIRTAQLGERFELGRFIGKTLLLGADVPSNFLLQKNSGRIKSLCGHDHLTAELKGVQAGVSLVGRFNLIITANDRLLLNVDGDVQAWKRRVIWLPFERPATATPIPDFDKILLREEGSGILRWMIEGASRLCQFGFPKDSASARRVEELLQESDSVYGFLREQVERANQPHSDLTASQLLSAYDSWCYRNNWTPLMQRSAQIKMREGILSMYGVKQSHDLLDCNNPVRGYHGLRFRQ